MKQTNLLITGVGGQGIIRVSHILGKAAIRQSLSARVGETYGSSMRGGPVTSHVRLGEEIYSPLNSKNRVDVILGLEPMEGLRNVAEFLSPNGFFLTNTEKVTPYDVNIGRAEYPQIKKIEKIVEKTGAKVKSFNATELAEEVGSIKSMNIVMLGALQGTGKTPLKTETLKETIQENVPKNTREINMRAFEAGLKVT